MIGRLIKTEHYKAGLVNKHRLQELRCELQSLIHPNDKYDMGLWDNFINQVVIKYADFSGRMSRSEFWQVVVMKFLIIFLIDFLFALLALATRSVISLAFFGVILLVVVCISFIPVFAVQVRRLHDLGKSGESILLNFIPIIGHLLLLYWYSKCGTIGGNEYGNQTAYEKITPEMSKKLSFSPTPSNIYRWMILIIAVILGVTSLAIWIYSLQDILVKLI